MKHFFRTARHSPGFLLSGAAVLALGLASAILVFAIAHALLLSPVDYRDPRTLIQLRERDTQGNLAPLTRAELRAAQIRTAASAVDMGMFQLTGVAEPEEFAGAAITPNTLAMLGVRPILGHDLTAAQPDEVLLTHRAWTNRFGADPAIVGKTIDLDWSRTPARERYRVAGVLPARFWLIYRGLEVFVPLTDSILAGARPRQRYIAIARGAAGEWRIDGQPIAASPLLRDVTDTSRPAVAMLAAAAGLLLLLACANAASLFLARGLGRRGEFAVRLALGASRWDLARLVLADAAAVSLAAAAVAIPLARLGLALVARSLPADAGWLQFTPGVDRLGVDGWAAGFGVCAAFAAAAFASGLPVLQSFSIAGRLRGPAGRRISRRALISIETALATMLLCGATLLLQSVARLERADLGFTRARMLVARAPRIGAAPTPAYYDELRRRIAALPGVEAVTFTSFQPLTNTRPERRFSVAGGAESVASYCVVAPDFFDVYGAHLVAGRTFTAADRAGAPPAVVISASLARKTFADRSPLGERIQLAGDAAPAEIVGVVSDLRQRLRDPASPAVYRSAAQALGATLQMGIRTFREPMAVAAAVRREIGLAGGAAAELSDLEQFVRGGSWDTTAAGGIVAVFSLMALAVAAFGIFSVISYMANERRREIGIRMALGARPADVAVMLLRAGLRSVWLGVCGGLAAALALSRLVRGLLFDVQPDDPASYAAAAAVLLVAALCALAVPARRAMRTKPNECLREL